MNKLVTPAVSTSGVSLMIFLMEDFEKKTAENILDTLIYGTLCICRNEQTEKHIPSRNSAPTFVR